MPNHNRILVDRDVAIYAYSFLLAVVEYRTAILRRYLFGASGLLEAVPEGERNKTTRFLETKGALHQFVLFKVDTNIARTDLKALALEITYDPEHKFELAIVLDELETAEALAEAMPSPENETKWKMAGDTALSRWNLAPARECYREAILFSLFFSFYPVAILADGLPIEKRVRVS
jgi:coatomer subunit beta'